MEFILALRERDKTRPLIVNITRALNNLRWDLRSKSYLFSFIEINLLKLMYRTGIKKYLFDMYSEKEQLLSFGIDSSSEKAWDMLFFYLIKMKDFLSERKIGFMVVIFPYEFQLSNKPGDNFFNIDKSRFTINPQKKLMEFCVKNNILALDLLSDFKKSAKKIYFPLDYCHPNERGHRIAAEQIYKAFTNQLLP